MSVGKVRPSPSGAFGVMILGVATAFFLVSTASSWAEWANFKHQTFDLAFYTQAMWQFIHGRFDVSILNTPLLGNHVEPVFFLLAPIFAVFRHPMVFVVIQNAALAGMALVGFDVSRRLGFGTRDSFFLAAGTLIVPATGYVALSEFHPEALTAPLLLLLLRARLVKSVGQHWLWFIAVLACKENMALLLASYCVVFLVIERQRAPRELWIWYGWPLALALTWLLICFGLISPALNSNNIDYLGLYDRIGGSGGEILRNAIARPQLFVGLLVNSVTRGNLFWGLLLPFLCLPLLRPRWLLIAAPIFFQHLLSWRESEWTIYFHYAAPLLPIFWIATVEAVAVLKGRIPGSIERAIPLAVFLSTAVAQVWLGPGPRVAAAVTDWFSGQSDRAQRNALIASIPPDASVMASFPYLSHLALRDRLYSLHFVLKGLKTLSRAPFRPPSPTDYVLIDYGNSPTFDVGSGYYHPIMKMSDGRVIPSSDQLLHDFLKQRSWKADSINQLTLLRQLTKESMPSIRADSSVDSGEAVRLGPDTVLVSAVKSGDVLSTEKSLEIRMRWMFGDERTLFPWALLRLTGVGHEGGAVIVKGLSAPEAGAGAYVEDWRVTAVNDLPEGDYQADLVFLDNSRRTWLVATQHVDDHPALLSKPIPLGSVRILRSKPGSTSRGTP